MRLASKEQISRLKNRRLFIDGITVLWNKMNVWKTKSTSLVKNFIPQPKRFIAIGLLEEKKKNTQMR